MEGAGAGNDTRGWIMCIVSGIACVVGACVICVDLLIRYIPGKANFRIQDSNGFLACSLSLSFGVMLFSGLYSMLPSSKKYLLKAKYSEMSAGLIMMTCFVGGFIGIQVISRLFHQLLPSHVVDCDHSHEHAHDLDQEDHSKYNNQDEHGTRRHSRASGYEVVRRKSSHGGMRISTTTGVRETGCATEATPLLPAEETQHVRPQPDPQQARAISRSDGNLLDHAGHTHASLFNFTPGRNSADSRRPSMQQMRNRVVSFVKDTKSACDADGPCFGYSDPCGQECFKHLSSRSALSRSNSLFLRTSSGHFPGHLQPVFSGVPEAEEEDDSGANSPLGGLRRTSRVVSRDADQEIARDEEDGYPCDQMPEDIEAQEPHHHHVPTNAFLSIGLQTVIAIALHKFPEGFITYATNHASPNLGFNVFMALFVHNIAEGFAMALPLYMALGSRLAAIGWSSVLGGLSQPMGAGIAALMFKISNSNQWTIDNVAYACLFAVTAGIMTSVALQLFVESLSLNHNRNLSIAFAFLGMVLLGVSNAMVKDDEH